MVEKIKKFIEKKIIKSRIIINPNEREDIAFSSRLTNCTTDCPNCVQPAYQAPCGTQVCPGLGTCSTNVPIQVA